MPGSEKSQPPVLGRRSFIASSGKLLAGSAVAAGVASSLEGQARAEDGEPSAVPLRRRAGDPDDALRRSTYEVRVARAKANYEVPIAAPLGQQLTNGDEERYDNKLGTDTRALPHDARGEVLPAAYIALRRALDTRSEADFERVPLGGTRKLTNPLGPLGINLTGVAANQQAIAPAPRLASAARAAEAVENYWLALLRDVPFAEYRNDTSNELVLAAVRELDSLEGYHGPRDENGEVTPEVLFRGSARYFDASAPPGERIRHVIPPGVTVGPYISQFLLRDIPYNAHTISARARVPLPGSAGNDFLTVYDEWLAVQNGVAATRSVSYEPVPRYLSTGRDLAEFARGGGTSVQWAAFQLLSTAASSDPQAVGGLGAPSTRTNPYLNFAKQAAGTGTWGAPHVQSLLPLALGHALRANYFGKWYVHRTLRPEAYAGLIHHVLANGADYPVHADALDSEAVDRVFQKFGTYLLPHTVPEGAPTHASYPGGSSAQAAALATILKAFYDESWVIPDPVQPDPSDPTRLIPYVGEPLTLGGELNKLVTNVGIGRDWIGLHWRSDAAVGLAEAEGIALSILRDEATTFPETFAGFELHRFDGTLVHIAT